MQRHKKHGEIERAHEHQRDHGNKARNNAYGNSGTQTGDDQRGRHCHARHISTKTVSALASEPDGHENNPMLTSAGKYAAGRNRPIRVRVRYTAIQPFAFLGCLTAAALVDIGQKREKARALDGLGQFALLLCRYGRDAARHDLAALGNEAAQKMHVLVIRFFRALFFKPEKGQVLRRPRNPPPPKPPPPKPPPPDLSPPPKPPPAPPLRRGGPRSEENSLMLLLLLRVFRCLRADGGGRSPPRSPKVAERAFGKAFIRPHAAWRNATRFVFFDAHGEITQHVFIEAHVAFELIDRRRRRVDIEHHVMAFFIFLDAVGEGA